MLSSFTLETRVQILGQAILQINFFTFFSCRNHQTFLIRLATFKITQILSPERRILTVERFICVNLYSLDLTQPEHMIRWSFRKIFFPLWMTSKTNRSSIDVCPRCFSLYSSKLSCVLYCVYYVAPKDIAFMPVPKLYIRSALNTDYLLETFQDFMIA